MWKPFMLRQAQQERFSSSTKSTKAQSSQLRRHGIAQYSVIHSHSLLDTELRLDIFVDEFADLRINQMAVMIQSRRFRREIAILQTT